MSYSQHRARMEQALANAHKWLWVAMEAAESANDFGAMEDLRQLLQATTAIAEQSLKSKPNARPQITGQLSL